MQLVQGYLGVRLFFQKLGDGPQAVLVANGLFAFDDFARLASAERTLVFVDLRRGRSEIGGDAQALVLHEPRAAARAVAANLGHPVRGAAVESRRHVPRGHGAPTAP